MVKLYKLFIVSYLLLITGITMDQITSRLRFSVPPKVVVEVTENSDGSISGNQRVVTIFEANENVSRLGLLNWTILQYSFVLLWLPLSLGLQVVLDKIHPESGKFSFVPCLFVAVFALWVSFNNYTVYLNYLAV
jgi:hypothetical protein